MLRKTDETDHALAVPFRMVAFDRARTFITLLVVLHHSAVNYTHFGNGDKARWLGFDLVRLRSGRAVQQQLFHGSHVPYLGRFRCTERNDGDVIATRFSLSPDRVFTAGQVASPGCVASADGTPTFAL